MRPTESPFRPGLCEHIPTMIPGTGPGGSHAMVRAEGWCPDVATRRLMFKNGDVEHLCGRHAGIEKRMVHGRGVANEELIEIEQVSE